jgi:hypothetical protein
MDCGKDNVFNLERAMEEWRRQMQSAGIKSAALEELENHLREDIENQIKSEIALEQAFAVAVQRLGPPVAVQNEFAKAASMQRSRLQRWKELLLKFAGVPVADPMMLTLAARESLQLGGKEALSFHHDFIGTEHVLLGLLELETGIVRGVLQRLGINPKIVRTEIEKVVGPGPKPRATNELRYTPRVRKALEIAGSEARALKQTQVGAEHIFLGLLREGGGVASLVLKALGLNVQTAREEILRELGRKSAGI